MNRIEVSVITGESKVIPLTQEEIAAATARSIVVQKEARISEIKQRLTQIDADSVRALRAKTVGKGKPQDDTKLNDLDTEADTLRAELATIQV